MQHEGDEPGYREQFGLHTDLVHSERDPRKVRFHECFQLDAHVLHVHAGIVLQKHRQLLVGE